MCKIKRKAFTLLELLVVISIIMLIIGILLPAVNAAREAGRKIKCTNNQRQVAVALLNYESAKGYFPGWRNFIGMDDAQGQFTAQASWAFMILPFCEKTELYDRIKSGSAFGMEIPMVPILHCPSRQDSPSDYADGAFGRSMNYIVNCGAVDDCSMQDTLWTTDDNPANGVFLDMAAIRSGDNQIKNINGDLPQAVVSNLAYISRHDGTTYTFLLSENVQRGFWIAAELTHFACMRDGWSNGPQNLMNLADGEDMLEGMVGFCWGRTFSNGAIQYPDKPVQAGSGYFGFLTSDPANPIFNPVGAGADSDRFPCFVNRFRNKIFPRGAGGNNWYWSSRPSSWHPTVVVAAFCDGNVRTIGDSIDELVYVQMMTVSDIKSDAKNYAGSTLFDPSWLD